MMNGIHAEAVHAALKPKPQDIKHGAPDGWIAPIQIRLPTEIGMVIILAGYLVEGPGRSTEFADPIVRRTAVGFRISPDVPVAPGTGN